MRAVHDRCLKRGGWEPPLLRLDIIEDSLYVLCGAETESAEQMLGKFEKAIDQMETHAKGEMAQAYDPQLANAGVTAATEELRLVKRAMEMEAAAKSKPGPER